jgi:hypothetical protein
MTARVVLIYKRQTSNVICPMSNLPLCLCVYFPLPFSNVLTLKVIGNANDYHPFLEKESSFEHQ